MMSTKIFRRIDSHSKLVIFLFFFTVLARFPGQDGEDIVNARLNMKSDNPMDFWGGMSSLVYGHAPSFPANWQSQLVLLQVSLVFIGLKFLSPDMGNRIKRIFITAVYYFIFVFAAQTTRDGMLFSLAVFSFGVISYGVKKSNPLNITLGILVLILGISFRPWMAIAVTPFVAYYLRRVNLRKFQISIICLLVASVPILFDQSLVKILNLRASYPQQQVMIMDFASSYCWGNNDQTSQIAISALNEFTVDRNADKNTCNLYRIDTWLSLTKSSHPSSENLESPKFWLISPGSDSKYEKIQDSWVRMITSDPVTYTQNKFTFASKLLIGSDTRGFRFIGEQNLVKKFQGILLIPYDLAITFHLLSLGSFLVLLLLFSIIRRIRTGSKNFEFTPSMALSFASTFLWLILSSIAYIGSNGRYTYTVTLLSAIFILREESK